MDDSIFSMDRIEDLQKLKNSKRRKVNILLLTFTDHIKSKNQFGIYSM